MKREYPRCCENCGNSRCANNVVAIHWDECVDSGFQKHWRPKAGRESALSIKTNVRE